MQGLLRKINLTMSPDITTEYNAGRYVDLEIELAYGTVVQELNAALHAMMDDDPRVIVLGEDIADPYGGAFKVTQGLSTAFGRRTFSTPIAEGAIQTACQQSCPAQAIEFGDLNDPNSRVSRLTADQRSYRVLEELNIRPSVSYLAIVRHRPEKTTLHAQQFRHVQIITIGLNPADRGLEHRDGFGELPELGHSLQE